MAEEAVISELVSARLFPVTRENTGKFAIFDFEIGAFGFRTKIQSLSNRIP